MKRHVQLAGATLIMALLLVLPAVSRADHEPPRAEIAAAGTDQKGIRLSYRWFHRNGRDECIEESGQGVAAVQREHPLMVQPGTDRLVVRWYKRQRPRSPEVYAWTEFEGGQPAGSPQPLDFDLREAKGRGWRAIVDYTLAEGDLYLDAAARWKDQEHCSKHKQSAVWSFHLRADGP